MDDNALYRVAYSLADQTQKPVYIVWTPPAGLLYDRGLPYVVTEEYAEPYDREHGEKVQPRRPV